MKYSSPSKGRVNAWFFPCIYKISKELASSASFNWLPHPSITNSQTLNISCVLIHCHYISYWSLDCPYCPVRASSSWLQNPLDLTPEAFVSFLAFKMYQAHLVHFLPQTFFFHFILPLISSRKCFLIAYDGANTRQVPKNETLIKLRCTCWIELCD